MTTEHQTDFWGNAVQPRARQDWISSCQFRTHSDAEVFQEIFVRISQSKKPVVLLDLDSTLYEVGPRTFKIMNEWVQSEDGQRFLGVHVALSELKESHIGYSIGDTFQAVGLDRYHPSVQEGYESAKRFWLKRFFTSHYLTHDRPYLGAVEFVRKIHGLGVEVVYLTGRDEPNMGHGTRANLIRDGFPWDVERTHLLMKPSFGDSDIEFKRSAGHFVKSKGELIASFENEPMNVVALHDVFPDAMHIFVDTVCSQHKADPRNGLFRVSGFECNYSLFS
jgi:hypothetical protein